MSVDTMKGPMATFKVNQTDAATILDFIKRFKKYSQAPKFAQFSPNLAYAYDLGNKASQEWSDGF